MHRTIGVAVGCLSLAGCLGTSTGNTDGGASDGGAVKRVFVTSATFGADLATAGHESTGLAGADALCAAAAKGADLEGNWVAWLSDEQTSAVQRLADVGPWFSVDGKTRLFNNAANLESTPLAAITLTEQGTAVSGETGVWTGTATGGASAAGFTCQGWTTADNSRAKTGAPTAPADWTDDGIGDYCSSTHALYCFEQ